MLPRNRCVEVTSAIIQSLSGGKYTRLIKIKNVKVYRDGMPKSMQTMYRDDVIVKVNLQSFIPTSISH